MRAVALSLLLLLCGLSASAQSWQPVVDMKTTGYSDSFDRTVVRTKTNNIVYYVMNHSAIVDGPSSVRVYKGNAANPTGFAEMDAVHEPTDSTRVIGVDCRLNDSNGIISIAYQLTSPLEARYISFNTNTNTFGAVETIATVNHAPGLRYLSKVSLALDANGVPHVTFGGDNEGLFYSNRIGGSWSAKFQLSANFDDIHPSLTFGTDGVLHLAWMNFDSPRSILYRERSSTSGTWSATETVDGNVGTVGDKVDQSPSIALSSANPPLPLILYHEQADSSAWVIIKQRNAANSYGDVSPPASTAQGHDWAITVDAAGNWTICGHGNPNASIVEPQCMTRTSGTWGALTTLINDGVTHDGSASLRYDLVWPGDSNHLDLAYFDENSPTPDSFYMDATLSGPPPPPATPTASLSTASLSFQDQIVNTASAPQQVKVTNTGGGSLTISNIAVPAGYSQTNNCTASLAQNAFCTINVTFQPGSVNSFAGNLTITDNDGSSPTQSVALSGTGTDFSFPAPSGSGATGTLTTTTPASYSLTVSGVANFTDSITFACSNLPQNTSCAFTPATASPGSGSQTVMLSVARINNTAAYILPNSLNPALYGLAVALVFAGGGRRRKATRARIKDLALLILLVAVIGTSSCSGGGGAATPATLQPTPGTYSFTVKATFLGQSKPPITLTLIVQ